VASADVVERGADAYFVELIVAAGVGMESQITEASGLELGTHGQFRVGRAAEPRRVDKHGLVAVVEVHPDHDPRRFGAGSDRRLCEAWAVIIDAEHVRRKGKDAITGKVKRAGAGGEVNDRVAEVRTAR